MKILRYVVSLFIIYETSFYFVIGQIVDNKKTDCTILYNFLNGDSIDYANNCCIGENNFEISCDNEGYITSTTLRESSNSPDLSSFPYLSRIEKLKIYNINLKEIPDSVLKLTSLKKLFLVENKIEVIPSDIQNLSQLEKLYLYNNNIKELPNEIFNLKNLKSIKINDNPQLETKIIKFGDEPLENCDFSNIKISCYEPHSCKTVILNNERELSDAEAQNEFKICTREEIDEVLNKNDKKSNSTLIIILGSIAVIGIGIGILVTFIYIKRTKPIKRSKSYFNLEDKFQTKGITNNNQSNNNINNINEEINIKDDNNTNNANNNNNNINKSNSFQISINRNKSIIVNLNDIMNEIHHGGSYSSYTSNAFSSFSLS